MPCPVLDTTQETFLVHGTVVGPDPGPCDPVFAAWMVDPDGEYWYKYGDGIAREGSFDLAFEDDPPGKALFGRWGVGIALVVLGREGESLPDGIVESDRMLLDYGLSLRDIVVWKPEDYEPIGKPTGWIPVWPDEFPVGWSCGSCVHEEGWDGFRPAGSCQWIEILTGESLDETDFCEWD